MSKILTKHFWVVHLVFVACAAWLLSYLFVLFIQERLIASPRAGTLRKSAPLAGVSSEPYEKYSSIPERNIFSPADRGQKLLPLEERKLSSPAGGAADGSRPSSPGNYLLVGTIIGPGGHSWAILQEKGSRKQQVFRVQGNIDGGKIIQVSRNQIQIERDGKKETLKLFEEEARPRPPAKEIPPPSAAPPKGEVVRKLSANRFLVNREDVNAAVGDINQFMTQARLRPNFEMGKPSGYAVSEVVPGSLMEKLGLRNNDIIKKVNGMAVTQPEEVMQAYAQLQRDSNIEVEVERSGRSEIFRYEIR
jgi:type II secretion system protein C